jgi:hypothetical protein
MNRLKLWLFALVVVAAAAFAVHVHTRTVSASSLAAIDAQVERAAVIAGGAVSELSREAAALAAVVVRDPALARALGPAAPAPAEPLRGRRARLAPPAAPVVEDPAAQDAGVDRAAALALKAAAQALGAPEDSEIVVASAGALERRMAGAGDAAPLLRAAAAGTSPRAHVRHDGRLWAAAASPIGEGGAVVVLVPIDQAWVRTLAARAAAEVIVVGPEAKTITTGAPPDVAPIVKAAAAVPNVLASVGRMPSVEVGIPRLPKVPLLLVSAPARRAIGVPLPGVRGALVVLSVATGPSLAHLATLQWWVLAGLVVVLVLALLFSMLVRTAEPAPMLPEPLLAAAARIEAGDFEARAPRLAGKVGTVAAALNRAAEAAASASAAAAAPPAPAVPGEDLFARAARPPEADPSAFVFPARPAAPAAPEPAPPPPEPSQAGPEPTPAPVPAVGGAFQAAPAPPPVAAQVAAAPELLQSAARAAPPSGNADGDDEQVHWRQVFEDFIRTRTECGEPAEGLTFERFSTKLASNRTTLVAKYGCRTVRFQVYVKDGKTALKATPVR